MSEEEEHCELSATYRSLAQKLDYTSDAGTADLWSPRSLRRSGLTITAVTFNLPYLLLNSRHRVLICLYARCRFLDAEGLVRGDSVGEPKWQGLARRL